MNIALPIKEFISYLLTIKAIVKSKLNYSLRTLKNVYDQ